MKPKRTDRADAAAADFYARQSRRLREARAARRSRWTRGMARAHALALMGLRESEQTLENERRRDAAALKTATRGCGKSG